MKLTDEEIEKAAKEYAEQYMDSQVGKEHIALACADFTKWARDQQPKLKPMPWEYDEPFDWWIAETSFGQYIVRTRVTTPDKKFINCNDFDHGKQLAQADYERRINELYI